ncbi:hypothetical protein KM043_010882 [Ampulex compressa]|nr:hypothetical protein KM043_010882 [Ampulex compressa]
MRSGERYLFVSVAISAALDSNRRHYAARRVPLGIGVVRPGYTMIRYTLRAVVQTSDGEEDRGHFAVRPDKPRNLILYLREGERASGAEEEEEANREEIRRSAVEDRRKGGKAKPLLLSRSLPRDISSGSVTR